MLKGVVVSRPSISAMIHTEEKAPDWTCWKVSEPDAVLRKSDMPALAPEPDWIEAFASAENPLGVPVR
jgi:hypothetical protein